MKTQDKGILIAAIIHKLNEMIKNQNKKLCSENLHDHQMPLHGGEMFIELAFLPDEEISNIARQCGI